mgnify:CR=1 FL=1
MGGNEFYYAQKYKDSYWVGMDIEDSLFNIFRENAREIDNVKLVKGDWFHLDRGLTGEFDGIISLQAISWLSEWERPLQEICCLQPKWIALSSLFYEGDIEYIIRSYNYERVDEKNNKQCTEAFYNIYSIPKIKEYLYNRGYKIFHYEPFEIDIDIPKQNSFDWGTYTVKLENGKRLQISAAMLMPWYFIFASK